MTGYYVHARNTPELTYYAVCVDGETVLIESNKNRAIELATIAAMIEGGGEWRSIHGKVYKRSTDGLKEYPVIGGYLNGKLFCFITKTGIKLSKILVRESIMNVPVSA